MGWGGRRSGRGGRRGGWSGRGGGDGLGDGTVSFSIYGMREVVPGGIIRSGGKESYDAATEGFYMGIPDEDGYTVFGVGNGTSYMRWDRDNGLVVAGDGSGLTSIDGGNIQTGTITATQLAADSVTASEIAAGAVDTEELAAGAVTAAKIEAATITADKLNVATLSAITANLGTVNIDDVVSIDTDGGIYQGTGTFESPFDGLKIYNSSGYGTVEAYKGGVVMWRADQEGLVFRASAWQGLRWEKDDGTDVVTTSALTGSTETNFTIVVTPVDSDESHFAWSAGRKAVAGGEEQFIKVRGHGETSPYAQIESISAIDDDVVDVLVIENNYDSENGSGASTDGIGAAITLGATTTAETSKVAARIEGIWEVATDASRKGELILKVSDASADREGIRIGTSGSEVEIGLYGVEPIARPSAYTFTNGNTDRSIDCDSTTLAELADVVYTMWSDLKDLGALQ